MRSLPVDVLLPARFDLLGLLLVELHQLVSRASFNAQQFVNSYGEAHTGRSPTPMRDRCSLENARYWRAAEGRPSRRRAHVRRGCAAIHKETRA